MMQFSIRTILRRLHSLCRPVRKTNPASRRFAHLAGGGRGLETLEERLAPATVGNISTVAGGGVGDGLNATLASLSSPGRVAVDSAGDLFIADTFNNRIREVNHATGIITTVAGDGVAGFSNDGQAAVGAELNNPTGVAVDATGN